MRVILSLVMLLLLFGSGGVRAEPVPVYIESGLQQGQGLLIPSTKNCLVVTAGHTVADAGRPMISRPNGVRVAASGVLRAAGTDIALLSFDRMSYGEKVSLCQFSSMFFPLRMREQSDDKSDANRTFFATRVSARAGGVVYVPLKLVSSTGDQLRFRMQVEAPIVQSDSGMPIWLYERTPSPQFTDRQLAEGRLTGFVLAVEGQDVVAAKAEHVSRAVYDLVDPIDPSQIVDPQQVPMISYIGHGSGGSEAERKARERSQPRYRGELFHDDRTLGRTSIQFDLGNADYVFSGLSFRARGVPSPYVLTNQFRPRDGSKWTAAYKNCQTNIQGTIVMCEMAAPQIVRGIWLDIKSPATSIKGLQLKLARVQ